MCGIVGAVANVDVVSTVIDGLRRLEYRGYDSAGVAAITEKGLDRRRAEGKINALDKVIAAQPLAGTIAIGHTRWATHGAPSETNAHPHISDNIAVVHNGIIENFLELKAMLKQAGYTFTSDTDTEVIPHLLHYHISKSNDLKDGVIKAIAQLRGAFAIGVITANQPDLLIATTLGAPLVIGKNSGLDSHFIASDALALANYASHILYLEDGDVAFLQKDKNALLFNATTGIEKTVQYQPNSASGYAMEKEGYRHFMLKEIFEQPRVCGDLIRNYFNINTNRVTMPDTMKKLAEQQPDAIQILACGTSYYAGSIAKYWFERFLNIPCAVEMASEFRYRQPALSKNMVALAISQSGETADTLAAMRYAKQQGLATIAIVNVTQSTLAREADAVLPIYSGPEIGVASTKAFTSQLLVLMALMAYWLERKNPEILKKLLNHLSELPAHLSHVLKLDEQIQQLAHSFGTAQHALYVGRGVHYPLAMEGALKLKEISYVHAEATAAGELKHGPIALVDDAIPVIALAPYDDLFEKMASNIREIHARGGKILLLTDAEGQKHLADVSEHAILLPTVAGNATTAMLLNPLIYALPMQLLAYHVAVLKGTDVDQPRNLAKSVTVE